MISLIVAASENGVIGRDGDLPWRLSSDLRRFKRLTMGSSLIMGRKTYESIGRPLPGRKSIVITRQTDYSPAGVVVASSVQEALSLAGHPPDIFVIGGGQIYQEALPFVSCIYLTLVHAEVEGDTFFPPLDSSQWTVASREEFNADAKNDYPHSFIIYDRVHPNRPPASGD